MSTNTMPSTPSRFTAYWQLMRFDRPIGTLLLLWPTMWSLLLAGEGMPSLKNLGIFIAGVILMRAAGCVINDIADRRIDGQVKRTRHRPLVTGAVSVGEAWLLLFILTCLAFALVLMTNRLTILLSIGGVGLAFCYPFMKRYTHLPQVVLGAAFAWSIPMAFAAEKGEITPDIWVVYITVVLWTVAYDTFYAMVDRDDDIKLGVKSTAILFAELDKAITATLQLMVVAGLVFTGQKFQLGVIYFGSVGIAACLFIYQQYLIRHRDRDACFQAFLNNNWVGMIVFVGIVLDYSLAV